MNKTVIGIVYALVMIATVVTADLLFFRDEPGTRLVANVLIVGAFGAVYLLFIRNRQ